MQQYYRLMKSILFVLFLSFGIISCEKEDPVSTSPNTGRRTTLIRQILILPTRWFVRIMNKLYLCICPGRLT